MRMAQGSAIYVCGVYLHHCSSPLALPHGSRGACKNPTGNAGYDKENFSMESVVCGKHSDGRRPQSKTSITLISNHHSLPGAFRHLRGFHFHISVSRFVSVWCITWMFVLGFSVSAGIFSSVFRLGISARYFTTVFHHSISRYFSLVFQLDFLLGFSPRYFSWIFLVFHLDISPWYFSSVVLQGILARYFSWVFQLDIFGVSLGYFSSVFQLCISAGYLWCFCTMFEIGISPWYFSWVFHLRVSDVSPGYLFAIPPRYFSSVFQMGISAAYLLVFHLEMSPWIFSSVFQLGISVGYFTLCISAHQGAASGQKPQLRCSCDPT